MAVAGLESATVLAERAGLKDAGVRHYLNGTRKLTNRAAEALARPLNCEASWLMFGTGKGPVKPPEDELPARNFRLTDAPPRPDFQHTIEVKGTAQGGKDGRFYFNGETVDRVARPAGLAHKMSVYCIRLDGDSMSPVFEDGDLLFVDSGRRAIVGRDAVIELYPEEDGEPAPAFVKRVTMISPSFVELMEFKPKERTFKVQRDKIKSLHLILKNNEMY